MVYVFVFILCVLLLHVGFMAGSFHGYDKGFEDCKQATLEYIHMIENQEDEDERD